MTNSPDNLTFYKENGYLIIEDYLSDKDIKSLRESAYQIVEDFDMNTLSIFTTEEQSQHTDRYFLESAYQVSCFFEPEAIGNNGVLTRSKHLAVNKIGHAMHDLIPTWQQISYRKSLYKFAKAVGLEEPSIVQSQYIYKQPQIGGRVHAHTDATFIMTKPASCLGAWVALEDANQSNGCLLAIPGSHKWPLQNYFIRTSKQEGTALIPSDNEKVVWDEEQFIPLEVKKGTLIFAYLR